MIKDVKDVYAPPFSIILACMNVQTIVPSGYHHTGYIATCGLETQKCAVLKIILKVMHRII